MEEVWKTVSEIADWVQVSNTGRVRSLDHPKYMHHGNRSYWCTRKGIEYSFKHNARYMVEITTQDYEHPEIFTHHKLYIDYLLYKYFIDSSITKETVIYHIDGDYDNDSINNLSLTSKYKATTDIEDEIWKPVTEEALVGCYEVSNYGNVRSLERIRKGILFKSEVLKPYITKQGYCTFDLMGNDNKKYKLSAHRLVAKAFIPNLENKPFINHKDFNPSNNRIENLEWCTPEENIQYSAKRGRYHMKRPWAYETVMKYRASKVKCITDGKVFDSMAQADRYYGYYVGRVSSSLNKRNGRIENNQFVLLEEENNG